MRAGRMLAAGVIAAAAKTTTQATHVPLIGNHAVAHACGQSTVRTARMQHYNGAYDGMVPVEPPEYNGTVKLTYDSCTRKTRASYSAQVCYGGGCGEADVINTQGQTTTCTTDYGGCTTGWINDAGQRSAAEATYIVPWDYYYGKTGWY